MNEPSTSDASPEPQRPAGQAPTVGPVLLRVREGPLAGPALGRVVSMMLARTDCPLDKLDDALILCDALSAHTFAYALDSHISFTLDTEPGELELRVAELAPGGAARVVNDARLPEIGNVIERFSSERRVETAVDGTGEALVLKFAFA